MSGALWVDRRQFMAVLPLLCAGCAAEGMGGKGLPSVTRAKILATAEAYRTHRWKPTQRNVKHGIDGRGIRVHTPDADYRPDSGTPGWWVPEQWNEGVPYQWGGFSTLRAFDQGVAAGMAAGDVYTDEKRALLEAAVSREAVGIDCSGFVSRCWGLQRSYSTRELGKISRQLKSYDELKPGDILNTYNAHCLIFAGWVDQDRQRMWAYETGVPPLWKVVRHRPTVESLKSSGFVPLRYLGVKD